MVTQPKERDRPILKIVGEDPEVLFNVPGLTEGALQYLAEVLSGKALAGDGPFTARVHRQLIDSLGAQNVLLTHSCTAALEMAALILQLQPGDEVIMPSFTFSSTANAMALRGAVPVFVDIRRDTLNLDDQLIIDAIGPKTKAILPVHYAGIACEMDTIVDVARAHNLSVIEDAAQGIDAYYKNRPLGTIGDFGALSFHETKNLVSGEGGALIIGSEEHNLRAEAIREKGTNRSQFLRGEISRYEWEELGSSYLPSEMVAAVLLSQLESAEPIKSARMILWNRYHEALRPLEQKGYLERPRIPLSCEHNAISYYVVLDEKLDRDSVSRIMALGGINAYSHYVPLHNTRAGLRYGRTHGTMAETERASQQILRLPLWFGLTEDDQSRAIDSLGNSIKLQSENWEN